MKHILPRFCALLTLAILSTGTALAQPHKGTFIQAQAGFGYNYTYDDVIVEGTGFFAQGEFVWAPATWFGVRPYAGVIFVSSDKQDAFGNVTYALQSNGALVGVKARFLAPIPWVAPFIELGSGLSLGTFETQLPNNLLRNKGPVFHMPVTLGLAIGRNHRFELALQYYFMDSVEQAVGAMAFGIAFPLD